MVEEKGLDPSAADKIWEYVQKSGELSGQHDPLENSFRLSERLES